MTNFRNINGIWDVNASTVGLGKLIIFHQELLQLSKLLNVMNINIYFCGTKGIRNIDMLTTISQLNPLLGELHFIEDCRAIKSEKRDFVWPDRTDGLSNSYSESYLTVQKYWKQTGKIVELKSPENSVGLAKRWLSKYADSEIVISVHLKNNPNDGLSNANQDAWHDFFQKCKIESPQVKYVLIGSDVIDDRISTLTNVVLAKDHGGNLELDMAIIELSAAFMGMASGPCNRAILSNKPYLIWKHPGHHQAKMEDEFIEQGDFNFANESQKLMLEWDTAENIQREFTELIPSLSLELVPGCWL